MQGRTKTSVAVGVLLLAGGILPSSFAQNKAPETNTVPRPPERGIYKLEPLTQQQFEALPDSQLVEVNGERTTKGALQARIKQNQLAAQARIEARRAKFLEEQRARREAENAKALAEVSRISERAASPGQTSSYEVLEREASELLNRYKSASPAEQAEIERRAGEILWQLKRLGR